MVCPFFQPQSQHHPQSPSRDMLLNNAILYQSPKILRHWLEKKSKVGRTKEGRIFNSLPASRAEECWNKRLLDDKLSIIFLFPSILITSPLRVASFHILVRTNISLMFRSDELAPTAQLGSPFLALSSLLQFPRNVDFTLAAISRAIFCDSLSSGPPYVTIVALQVAQAEFCMRPKQ